MLGNRLLPVSTRKFFVPVPIATEVTLAVVVLRLLRLAANSLISSASPGRAPKNSSPRDSKFDGSSVLGGVGNGVIGPGMAVP
jgi:hypothetical protein